MARTRRYNKHKAKKHTRRMRRKVKKHSRRMRRKSSFRKTKHKKKRGGAPSTVPPEEEGEIEMTRTVTERGKGADAKNKLIVTSTTPVDGHPQYLISYNAAMKNDISSYGPGYGAPFRMNQARKLEELLASFHELQDVKFPGRKLKSTLWGLTSAQIEERTNGLNEWFNAAYDVRESLTKPGLISEGAPEGGRKGERLFVIHFNKILPSPDSPDGAGQIKDEGTPPGHAELRGAVSPGPAWSPLPKGWTEIRDEGMPYYLNRITGESSKYRPRIIRGT